VRARLNVRKINLALWTLTTSLAAGAVVCAALGVLTPVEVDSDPRGMGRRVAATSRGAADSQLSLAEFEPIWRLHLGKSLADAAAAAPVMENSAAPAVAGPSGPFVLIGTIGDSLALVRTSAGVVETRGVGELVNGAKIVAIRTAQVDVEVEGRRMTIAKPREGSGG
jgi:hypothetical protein